MLTRTRFIAVALAIPMLASAQAVTQQSDGAVEKDSAKAPSLATLLPPITMQHYRPADMRGNGMFETPKESGIPYTGFRMSWGASFRQQFQGLEHSNTAAPVMSGTTNQNALMDIGRGFNLANANLAMNMQIADGIRVHLSTYLSSKHHQETWVKDGYFLMDKSPIDHPLLNQVMKYTTLKVGHFEINYGDQHFRRTDNGNAMHNPFVGNYILDAFTTEIGGEAYFRHKGWMAMAGLTSGTINGGVTTPDKRSNAYLAKAGYDGKLTSDLRLRLTGSYYKNDKSPSNTLVTGDRAGSSYNLVMENTAASLTSAAWSGQIRPGLANSVRAYAINPFVQYKGVEFFGTAENFKGKTTAEAGYREWDQYAGEVVYRFGPTQKFFSGLRANTVKGALANTSTITYAGDVSVDRYAASAGWYITPVLLLKGEYMQQKYFRFPATDIRNGGKIQGFVLEGVVSF